MISTSKFKRMFLIPEFTYRDIMKKSDNMERNDMEEINKNFEDNDYVNSVLEKEPKYNQNEVVEYDKKDSNKNESDSDHEKIDTTLNDTVHSTKEPSLPSTNRENGGGVVKPRQVKNTKTSILNASKHQNLQDGNSVTPQTYNCQYCGKHYVRKSAFNSHTEKCKTMTRYKYRCKVENCGKEYVNEQNLKKHQSLKHSSFFKKIKKVNRKSDDSFDTDKISTRNPSRYKRSYTRLVK